MRTRNTHSTGSRDHRKRWSLHVTVLLMVAAFIGACSPDEAAEGTDESPLIAYAVCMRDHGIEYPDPVDIGGELTSRLPDDFDLESPEFIAAEAVCNSETPRGDVDNPEDQGQQAEGFEAALKFAACMRDQGMEFPDPVAEGNGFSGPAGPLGNDPEDFDESSQICEEKIGATTTP